MAAFSIESRAATGCAGFATNLEAPPFRAYRCRWAHPRLDHASNHSPQPAPRQLPSRPDRYPDRCGDSKVNTPGTAEPLLCDLALRASRALWVETRFWLYENVQGRVRQRDQEASPGLRGLFQIAP